MHTENSKHDDRLFDRWAPTYDRSTIHQRFMFEPVHNAVLDAFKSAGATPRDVLDVGCGTGRLLETAARRWPDARLTGVDVSQAMIAEAERKHQGDARFTFKAADAAALPLEPSSFDAAFCTMTFHHWGDQAAGIREVARVLRPGGLFVLADVDVPLLFLFRPIINLSRVARFRSPQETRQLFEQAALSVLECRRFWRISRVQLLVGRK